MPFCFAAMEGLGFLDALNSAPVPGIKIKKKKKVLSPTAAKVWALGSRCQCPGRRGPGEGRAQQLGTWGGQSSCVSGVGWWGQTRDRAVLQGTCLVGILPGTVD